MAPGARPRATLAEQRPDCRDDPDGDVGLYTGIGVQPHEGTIDVGLATWLPGGGLDHIRSVREQTTMLDTVLVVGGARYEMLSAGEAWRLTVAPGTGRSGDSPVRRQGHLEQAGRWSGWIDVAGRRIGLGADRLTPSRLGRVATEFHRRAGGGLAVT